VSDTSAITSGLAAVVPPAFEADPNLVFASFIVLLLSFLVITLSETVSKTNLTSFTLSALSKAAIMFTF
jgi:hypothetical protein